MANEILLIGGSNVDYLAESAKKLIRKDSNPGCLRISFGGVGRNIVENLARLGNKVTFITGIGSDAFGKAMVEDLEKRNVKVIYPKQDVSSSSYLAILDATGDMDVAVCDSRAIDNLSFAFVREHKELLEKREYIVAETNLSQQTLKDLICSYPDKKWLIEAVSTSKVKKVKSLLSSIYLLKGNLMEAEEAADFFEDDIEALINVLLKKGVKNVVITQGANSVWYGNEKGIDQVPVIPAAKVVSTNGAGDAMFAGIVDKINAGKSLREAIEFGMKLSSLKLLSSKAVSEKIDTLAYKH
jgi:pseudouridine kinase